MSKKSVKVYWWNNEENFGDSMNPVLLNSLFGLTIEWADLANADMVASGSVIQWITPALPRRTGPIHVWGSGFIFGKEPAPPIGSVIYSAVRGKNSAMFAGLPSSTITGDPGLLATHVLKRKRYRTHKLGVVPHLNNRSNPILRALIRESGARFIDVSADPVTVIEEIASCSFVFSTSLHGLIVADGFEIPNLWLSAKPLPFGGSWKFDDYFSNFGLKMRPVRISASLNLEKLAELERGRYARPGIETLKTGLMNAFPFTQ